MWKCKSKNINKKQSTFKGCPHKCTNGNTLHKLGYLSRSNFHAYRSCQKCQRCRPTRNHCSRTDKCKERQDATTILAENQSFDTEHVNPGIQCQSRPFPNQYDLKTTKGNLHGESAPSHRHPIFQQMIGAVSCRGEEIPIISQEPPNWKPPCHGNRRNVKLLDLRYSPDTAQKFQHSRTDSKQDTRTMHHRHTKFLLNQTSFLRDISSLSQVQFQ